MEPDLTDVGSTLEEALQLRQEHNEMLAKLKVNATKGSLLKLKWDKNYSKMPKKVKMRLSHQEHKLLTMLKF